MRQEEPMDLWVYEREAFDAGIKLVCGVDEAGRGPLAGPVCAAAVMLPPMPISCPFSSSHRASAASAPVA